MRSPPSTPPASTGAQMARVTDELDAVVHGTLDATDGILSAAETIDNAGATLSRSLTGHEQELASDIQDSVVQIFEACNFQDLTGQRITKVVNTLSFVEEHIVRMMEIWGGIESFKDIEVGSSRTARATSPVERPGSSSRHDIASQDDIDALFA